MKLQDAEIRIFELEDQLAPVNTFKHLKKTSEISELSTHEAITPILESNNRFFEEIMILQDLLKKK